MLPGSCSRSCLQRQTLSMLGKAGLVIQGLIQAPPGRARTQGWVLASLFGTCKAACGC